MRAHTLPRRTRRLIVECKENVVHKSVEKFRDHKHQARTRNNVANLYTSFPCSYTLIFSNPFYVSPNFTYRPIFKISLVFCVDRSADVMEFLVCV